MRAALLQVLPHLPPGLTQAVMFSACPARSELRGYSFTPPSDSPLTRYLFNPMNSAITGMHTSSEPAA